MWTFDSRGRSAPPAAEPLATVATYSGALEAQLGRSALAAHGIRAFIADEHSATLNPHYIGAALGIRLQVRRADLVRAAEILRAPPSDDEAMLEEDEDRATEQDGPRCPRCEARYAYREWSSGEVVLIFVLLGLPLLFLEKRWHCRKCSAAWLPEPPLPRRGGAYRAPRTTALRREPRTTALRREPRTRGHNP